ALVGVCGCAAQPALGSHPLGRVGTRGATLYLLPPLSRKRARRPLSIPQRHMEVPRRRRWRRARAKTALLLATALGRAGARIQRLNNVNLAGDVGSALDLS